MVFPLNARPVIRFSGLDGGFNGLGKGFGGLGGGELFVMPFDSGGAHAAGKKTATRSASTRTPRRFGAELRTVLCVELSLSKVRLSRSG